MSERTVACCPECGSTSVQTIKSAGHYCTACDDVVGELDEREVIAEMDIKPGTAAAWLDDADPDDLDDKLAEASRR